MTDEQKQVLEDAVSVLRKTGYKALATKLEKAFK